MTETDYTGIDYGLGQTNIDDKGIRYGIIHTNNVAHWIWDEIESDYGNPHCGHCGNELDQEETGDYDFNCPHCGEHIRDLGDECYPEEALGHYYDNGSLAFHIDSYGDIWVTKSPYVTRAQFCSPCAPGAVYLSSPCPTGAWGYCLPSDWYEEDRPMPYVAYPLSLARKLGDCP